MAAGQASRGSGASFAHLHVHTEYSMLDGAARLKEMFAECERSGMSAVAITDHGNVYGAYDFWSKAQAAGIKPIIGTEAYIAPEHRGHKQPVRWGTPAQKDDDVSGAGAYTHMTLLAETTEGMHNLFTLSSLASLEGYFRKPRMDRELLSRYAKGIIATTGCVGGEVQTRLRLGQYDKALAAAAEFRDIFGPDNFFVELMHHDLAVERRSPGRAEEDCRGAGSAVPGHERFALHPGAGQRPRTRYCCACRPARTWPTRQGSGSRVPATT